jgi:hypothetical protein
LKALLGPALWCSWPKPVVTDSAELHLLENGVYSKIPRFMPYLLGLAQVTKPGVPPCSKPKACGITSQAAYATFAAMPHAN